MRCARAEPGGASDAVTDNLACTGALAIDGVPAMAINGKYYTSPSMTGSNQNALRAQSADRCR